MRLYAILEAMVSSGTTPEQMLAVVRAAEQSNADALERRRASDRDRQAKHRGHVMSRDVTLVTRDSCDIPAPKDPQPLSETPEVNPTPPPSISSPSKAKTDWPKEPIDLWWPIYPRRVAKGDARKALEKAQRLGKVTFADLCDATRRFAADPGCDPQFIPYPASWLNDERWADDKLAPVLPMGRDAMAPVPFDSPAYKPLLTRYRHEHGGADPPMNGKSAMLPADWVQASNEAVRRMQQ